MGTWKIYSIILALIVCALGVLGCEDPAHLLDYHQPVSPLNTPTLPPPQTPTPIPTLPPESCTPLNPNPKEIDICKFEANFVKPATYYTVIATGPMYASLYYKWSNTNHCGTFTDQGNKATWYHPDSSLPGACPNQDVHPGTISVIIGSSRGGTVECIYSYGSAAGKPAVCYTP